MSIGDKMKILTPKRRLYNLRRSFRNNIESMILNIRDISERKALIFINFTLIALIIIVLKIKGI